MSDFVYRGYRPGDEYRILEMFNEVFHQDRDLSHWYWKYRDHPLGAHFISLAESPEGELAAHYGGYPVRMYYGPDGQGQPREFTTFHLGDKMTRRKARASGFGKTSVLARTFDHFRKRYAMPDIPFGYGFGTHHSLRFGLLFLGYADVERVAYRKCSLSRVKAPRAAALRRLLSGVAVQELTDAGEEWTEFFNRVAESYQYLAVRDARYLMWRYFQRPDRRYLVLGVRKGGKPVGWSVFHREGTSVQWGDALFDPAEVGCLKHVIDYLRGHRFAASAGLLEAWFPARPRWWNCALEDIGLGCAGEPRDLHLTGPVFHDPEAPEKMRRYLYYTMGDSDLF